METVPRVWPLLTVSFHQTFWQNHSVDSILIALCDAVKQVQLSFNEEFFLNCKQQLEVHSYNVLIIIVQWINKQMRY